MGRKVSVGLEADVSKFIPPVEASKKAIDGLDRSVDELDRDLNKVPADAVKAAAAMKLLGGDLDGVGNKLQTVGDKSSALAALDAKIKASRAEVRKLGEEFVRTGNVDVFRKLGAADVALRGLVDIRKKLAAEIKEQDGKSVFGSLVGEASKEGTRAASTFASAFQGGVLNALTTPTGIGLAAVLGVGVAGAVGGATLAAAGLGAAGAAAAAGFAADAVNVHKAWSEEISKIKQEWVDAGKAAVEPTIAAVHTIGQDIEAIHFDKIVGKGAQYLEPFARAAGAALRYIGSGVETLIDKAGPEMAVLSKEVPEVGRALKEALDTIAGGSEGGARALTDFLHITEGVIVGTGNFIRGAEDIYGALSKASNASRDFVGSFNPIVHYINEATQQGEVYAKTLDNVNQAGSKSVIWIDGFSHEVENTAHTMDDFGKVGGDSLYLIDQRARDALATVERLNHTFEDLTGKLLNSREAAIGSEQAIDDLTAGFKRGNDALDIGTQKGRDNLNLIDNVIEAYGRQRDAAIASGGGTQEAYDQANAAYRSQLAALEALLVKLGLTKAQAHSLIAEFEELAKPLTKTITVRVKANVEVSAQGVISSGDLRRAVGSAYAHGGIRKAAAGLIIPPSDPGTTLVGEPQTGGEALIPLQGITQAAAMSLARVVGDSYGFEVSPRWRSMGSGSYARPNVTVAGQDLGPLLQRIDRLGDRIERMQIVMDGQQVGRVHGRQADLIRRAG